MDKIMDAKGQEYLSELREKSSKEHEALIRDPKYTERGHFWTPSGRKKNGRHRDLEIHYDTNGDYYWLDRI